MYLTFLNGITLHKSGVFPLYKCKKQIKNKIMAKRKIFCSDCGTEISKFDENNDLGYCPNEETWCEDYIEPTYQIGDTIMKNML